VTVGTAQRYRFLDGLRGWAAVVVLLHHLFVDGLPPNSLFADRALWSSVFFMNGAFAVCVFFVVSGFSLSVRFLETGDPRSLARIALGRYVRLAVPIAAICAATYVLLATGVLPPALQRPSPLDQFLTFAPDIAGLLRFSFVNVFVSYSNAETYNPPLWTMSYEFFGSFLTFAVIAVARPWSARIWVFGALFIALAGCQSYYALFVAGILLADLHRRLAGSRTGDIFGALLCAVGLAAVSLPHHAAFDLAYVVGATGLTAGVAFCAPLRVLFESRVSDLLGRLSFPLYLSQAAVIYVFSVHALHALSGMGLEPSAARWLINVATIPIALAAAVAFAPVNDFAVVASRRFGAAAAAWLEGIGRRMLPPSAAAKRG